MLKITKENLMELGLSFEDFKKKVVTPIARIKGPFTVSTKEGDLSCKDGVVAVDSSGWPYPISIEDFDNMYEKVQ